MKTFVPQPEWIILDWHRACIAAGTLCIQRCASCGRWRNPPRRFCAACFSDDAAFEPVSSAGSVLSKVVSHRTRDPGWQRQLPFATILVELDEGPRVLAATAMAPDEIRMSQRLGLRIEPKSADFVLVWADDAS